MWKRYLHRLRRKDEEDATPQEQAVPSRRWLHADGSVTEEEVCPPILDTQEETLEAPIRPIRRVARRTSAEQSYHQPYYPPQWQRTNEQGEQ